MKTTNKNQVIRAEVGDNFFEIVDRLFDNTPQSVCVELIQNARRAGATRIDFNTEYDDEGECVLTVKDNGSGIANMADLLRIRSSGWNDNIKRREDPAGMGFFCLCRMKNLRVRSRDLEVYMGDDAEALRGNVEVEVKHSDTFIQGTELRFTWPQLVGFELGMVLEHVGMYAPIRVTFNDRTIQQKSFKPYGVLDEFETDDMIVYIHRQVCGNSVKFNFHGLVVEDSINDMIDDLVFHVDVKETSQLQMVLPARNAIVSNQFYKDLTTEVRRRMFEIVRAGGDHNLPHQQWLEAEGLGIELPPASAELVDYKSLKRHEIDVDRQCYIMKGRSVSGKFESISAAMILSGKHKVYKEDVKMKGYAWYDALPSITDVIYMVNDSIFDLKEFRGARKLTGLKVHCEINSGTMDALELPTPILIGQSPFGEDSYSQAMMRGRGFVIDSTYKWSEELFSTLIDSAWRSYYMSDLQKAEWNRRRQIDVRKCLVSPEELLEFALKTAWNDVLTNWDDLEDYAGQAVTLTCEVGDGGTWKITNH